jgi:cell division protein FtsI (penicillin-binding protein 3)
MAEIRCKGRIIIVGVTVLMLFMGVSFRLCQIQLYPEPWVKAPLEKGRTLKLETVGSRGRILDRNGEILAMDLPAYHICVDPRDIAQHGDAFLVRRLLSARLGIEEEVLAEVLADTNSRYKRIKKYVPGTEMTDFKRATFGLIYEGDLGGGKTNVYLRGVMLEEAPIRTYQNGPLMAHVIGFSNREGVGGAGIELVYDELLRGKAGHVLSERDGRSRELYRRRIEQVEPEDGADVQLTLDQYLQYEVERIIEKTRVEFKAKAVWAIVQRVRTGEILAMASSPTYDLNRYSKAPPDWMLNRAIGYIYEPGSTMKVATVAAALDQGVVKADDMVDCENGYWVYGGKRLNDAHPEGVLSVADVIKVSSNIGTAKIALLMGNNRLNAALRGFRFGSRLGVGIPGEERGIFYLPKDWSKISITRISMGHEIGATALQVISMMSAVANNGVQMKPYVVRRIVAADGTVIQEAEPQQIGRPIKASTARLMRELLSRVTEEEEGTGTRARVEGYTVAGKTGTAQKVRPKEEGGGYYSKRFYASFAGFLPAENPELSIIVVADDPGTFTESGRKINYSGGRVCGPAFREIAAYAVRYFQIAPSGLRIEHIVRPEE